MDTKELNKKAIEILKGEFEKSGKIKIKGMCISSLEDIKEEVEYYNTNGMFFVTVPAVQMLFYLLYHTNPRRVTGELDNYYGVTKDEWDFLKSEFMMYA